MASAAHKLTTNELAQYFHLPISKAAKEVGVCATVLKKICRRNGIPRWPYRKVLCCFKAHFRSVV